VRVTQLRTAQLDRPEGGLDAARRLEAVAIPHRAVRSSAFVTSPVDLLEDDLLDHGLEGEAIPPLAGHLVVEVGMPVVSDEDGSSRRRRGRYPKQFRRDAAALVIDQHRSVADVARELGVIEQTLGNWVRQERIDRGEREGTTTQMREEDARLRREVKRLQMERDLLKRSVAFWVKERDR